MTSAMLIVLACLLAYAHGFPTNDDSGTAQAESDNCNLDPLVSSINDFSFDLAEKIGGQGNFFMSPLSIFAALGMTYMGSGGNTAAQMQDVLKLVRNGLQGRAAHERFRGLLDSLANVNGYQLNLANGMFTQQNYTVKQSFVQDARQYYKADVRNVDFATDGDNAVREINAWVANGTNDTIQKLFEENLDPLTRLVVLNAIYFNAAWKNPFNEDYTRNGTFYKNDNTVKLVPMMAKIRERFPYYEDSESGYQFLKLPYRGEDVSMLLALPGDRSTPADLRMTPELLCSVNSSLSKRELEDVKIPKFRLEHSEQLDDPLTALGMSDLFEEGVADLTGISESNDLYVASVLHKAFIRVDEKGTEASGATGVVAITFSISHNPSFIANHPFLFYIVDERNGLVLFSGRVADP